MSDTTTDLIARLRRIAKISYGATIDEAREVSQTLREAAYLIERVIGDLPQDAIDGGWTALGSCKYAKRLETQIETLQRERDEAVRDAERYRWLKAWDKLDGWTDEAIDREIAIDAAIKSGSEG
jgi:hypothetical protein